MEGEARKKRSHLKSRLIAAALLMLLAIESTGCSAIGDAIGDAIFEERVSRRVGYYKARGMSDENAEYNARMDTRF